MLTNTVMCELRKKLNLCSYNIFLWENMFNYTYINYTYYNYTKHFTRQFSHKLFQHIHTACILINLIDCISGIMEVPRNHYEIYQNENL